MDSPVVVDVFKIKCGQNKHWVKNPLRLSFTKPKKYTPRQSQINTIKTWDSDRPAKRHLLLIAPTGSGKTSTCRTYSDKLLRENPRLRCVFTVPQDTIAPGFKDHPEYGAILSDTDFCDGAAGKADRLISFLKEPLTGKPRKPQSRIAICTHALLVAVHKRLIEEGSQDAFENLLIWFDEGHHIVDSGQLANGLGEVSRSVRETANSIIGIMTATFFRNDKRDIVFGDMTDFSVFELPYDEYLQTMHFLDSFKLRFAYYRDSYENAIISLLTEKKKCIVYLTPRHWNVADHVRGDDTELRADIEKILGHFHASPPNAEGICTLEDGRRVLNLISPALRDQQKKFLGKRKQKDLLINADRNQIDIIFCVGMAQEGFDWHHVERIIQVGARRSIGQQVQINGRLLRDVDGRPNVETIILLPEASRIADDAHTDLLDHYVTAVFMAMLLEEIYDPIDVDDVPFPLRKGKKKARQNPLIAFLRLSKLNFNDLGTIAYQTLVRLKEQGVPNLYKSFIDTMASCYLDGNKLVARKLWSMYCRRSLPMQDSKVTRIKFSLLEDIDPLVGFKSFCVNTLRIGESAFSKLRQKLDEQNVLSFDEFSKLVSDHNINDSDAYQALRLVHFRLPPNPATAYPDHFKDWTSFRNLASAVEKFMEEKYEKSGSIFASRSGRKRRGKIAVKSLEIRYQDYCRELLRTGRKPVSWEDFKRNQSA